MFAMSPDSAPSFCEIDPMDTETETENGPPIQRDVLDALTLLRGPLTAAHLTNSANPTNDLMLRLSTCEDKLAASSSDHPLSPDDLNYINTFIEHAEKMLGRRVTDESTWGGRLPEALHLRDVVGKVDMANTGAESSFMLRGPTYLKDGQKVLAAAPLFFLRGMQIIEQPGPFQFNAAPQPWCGLPPHHYNEYLVLNYLVPGPTCVQVVCLFTASRKALELLKSTKANLLDPSVPILHASEPWAKCITQFWSGDDAYRDTTFKLWQGMPRASWMIKAAVGSRPALIGNKKLKLQYFQGPGYLEVTIDMSSSSVALNILGMVRGVSASMVVDVAVGVEAQEEGELPEALLCTARYHHMDLDKGGTLLTPDMLLGVVTPTGVGDKSSPPETRGGGSFSGSARFSCSFSPMQPEFTI